MLNWEQLLTEKREVTQKCYYGMEMWEGKKFKECST